MYRIFFQRVFKYISYNDEKNAQKGTLTYTINNFLDQFGCMILW